MSGVRQHILPRFLLKGFASRSDGQEVFTWVCRKERSAFEANITNVAVEKHFYDDSEFASLDTEITELERDFVPFLDRLRQANDAFRILDPLVAQFVGHLTSRTKHLRDTFIEMAGGMTSILSDYLADERNVRIWFFEYYKRHPEVVKQSIDDALSKMQLPRYQRRIARKRLQSLVNPHRLLEEMDIQQYALMFSMLHPMLVEKLPSIVKQGHIKALAKSLVAEPRAEKYQELHWFVSRLATPLILGDVGCLFEIVGEDKLRSLGGASDDVSMVYLPIASDCLLVGTVGNTMPELDFRSLNESFASYSRDFFVCRKLSDETNELHKILGTTSQIFSESELELMIKEVIHEM